jgi:hypothetical protein
MNHIAIDICNWRLQSFPRTGHHFWILVRTSYGQEVVTEAVHGLATQLKFDQNGKAQPYIPSPGIETWNSKLKVYFIPSPDMRDKTDHFLTPFNKNYWIEPDETYTQFHDNLSQNHTLHRWNQIKYCVQSLNKADIQYSFCGIGKGLGVFSKNSNSAYSSIAYIMGLKPHRFKGVLAPGSHSTMLARKEMDKLRIEAGVDKRENLCILH